MTNQEELIQINKQITKLEARRRVLTYKTNIAQHFKEVDISKRKHEYVIPMEGYRDYSLARRVMNGSTLTLSKRDNVVWINECECDQEYSNFTTLIMLPTSFNVYEEENGDIHIFHYDVSDNPKLKGKLMKNVIFDTEVIKYGVGGRGKGGMCFIDDFKLDDFILGSSKE